MKFRSFTKIALGILLICANSLNLFAQYKGAPVKRERLLKALRSRQLQTRDIVAVINSNGVDFALTDETKRILVAAGARPEVIKAIADNLRRLGRGDSTFAQNQKPDKRNKTNLQNYEDLLDQAMLSYKDGQNAKNAVQYLETAVKINPRNPAAYQMLGFVNLYGLKNIPNAEKLMRESLEKGGSAVFRVYHDDSGGFSSRCSGSLYISPDSIRFESDDNRHTFETSSVNIEKIKLDTESNRDWKKHSIIKIYLKFGKDTAKFRFAPISGSEAESAMVERFIDNSKSNVYGAGVAMNFAY